MPHPPKVNTTLCQKKVLISLWFVLIKRQVDTHHSDTQLKSQVPFLSSIAYLPNCLNNWQEEVNSQHGSYFFSKFPSFPSFYCYFLLETQRQKIFLPEEGISYTVLSKTPGGGRKFTGFVGCILLSWAVQCLGKLDRNLNQILMFGS